VSPNPVIARRRSRSANRYHYARCRDLDEATEAEFLDGHPALATELRRRAALGSPVGRRGTAGWTTGAAGRPYAHPDYWAPFVAMGA
jgi:hypothetical protein